MNTVVAEIIKSHIETLPFVDKIAGLVRPVKKVDVDDLERTVIKIFPVACNVTHNECENTEKYMELVPNSDYRTVIYFEDEGCVFVSRKGDLFSFKSSIRIVCWANMEMFDTNSCSVSANLSGAIISALPSNIFNSNGYQRIQISSVTIPKKNSDIFNQYTYSEETNQYLLYPYDYFAVDVELEFSVRQSCIDELQLKGKGC